MSGPTQSQEGPLARAADQAIWQIFGEAGLSDRRVADIFMEKTQELEAENQALKIQLAAFLN